MDFYVIVNKVERIIKFVLGFWFMVNVRDLYVKYLWLFYFYGWLSLVDCSFFMWEIDLRRLVRIFNLGLLIECVVLLYDGVFVDEDVCFELVLMFNLIEGVVWEEIIIFIRLLNDVECVSESFFVFGVSCEGFKEDLFMEGLYEIFIEL